MENITRLIRSVIKAFYTDEHAIVVDMLLDRHYLVDGKTEETQLSKTIKNVHIKKVHEILSHLHSHNLVQKRIMLSPERTEIEVWYIDYKHFIKVTRLYLSFDKLTSHKLGADAKSALAQDKDYECTFCHKQYETIEVYNTMKCEVDDYPVVEIKKIKRAAGDDDDADGGNNRLTEKENQIRELSEKFKKQLSGTPQSLMELLISADAMARTHSIPENDPSLRMSVKEREKRQREIELLNQANHQSGGASNATTTTSSSKRGTSELTYEQSMRMSVDQAQSSRFVDMAWIAVNVTGETTEAARLDEMTRRAQHGSEAKKTKVANDEEALKRVEATMQQHYQVVKLEEELQQVRRGGLEEEETKKSNASFPMFAFGKRSVALDEVTDEDKITMTDDEIQRYNELCDLYSI